MFDMFQLPFMVQAFAAAIITGILLSYLGVHVVGRGIVFVDLGAGANFFDWALPLLLLLEQD